MDRITSVHDGEWGTCGSFTVSTNMITSEHDGEWGTHRHRSFTVSTNRITSVHDGEWGTHRSFTVSMDMTASVDHGSGQSRHVYIKIKMTFLHKKFIL